MTEFKAVRSCTVVCEDVVVGVSVGSEEGVDVALDVEAPGSVD